MYLIPKTFTIIWCNIAVQMAHTKQITSFSANRKTCCIPDVSRISLFICLLFCKILIVWGFFYLFIHCSPHPFILVNNFFIVNNVTHVYLLDLFRVLYLGVHLIVYVTFCYNMNCKGWHFTLALLYHSTKRNVWAP